MDATKQALFSEGYVLSLLKLLKQLRQTLSLKACSPGG